MSAKANFTFHLPDDVFSYILLKLPIKSILVCTCVSKAWNSFIKSSAFVLSHLNHTITSYKDNNTHLYLLQLCSHRGKGRMDRFSLRSDDQNFSHYAPLYFPYRHQYGFQVLASCNGLVCLMDGKFDSSSCPFRLILWNPIIRKSFIIYERFNFYDLEVVGLGFDSRTGDYKVLTVSEHDKKTLKVKLYSLKSNSWERLADVEAVAIRDGAPNRIMTFLNGVLHFVAFRPARKPRFLILGFDLGDEVFSEIMLPDCIKDNFGGFLTDHNIWTCGESLSLLSCSNDTGKFFQVWVMKEYGVDASWTKLSTVRLTCLPDRMLGYQPVGGLVFRKNGHVLLGFGSYYSSDAVGQFYSHDPKSQETKDIEIDGKHDFIFVDSYVESLILLDKGNDLSRLFEIESCNVNDARIAMDYVYDESGDDGSSDLDYAYEYDESGDEGSSDFGEDSEEKSSGYSSGEAGDHSNSSEASANED